MRVLTSEITAGDYKDAYQKMIKHLNNGGRIFMFNESTSLFDNTLVGIMKDRLELGKFQPVLTEAIVFQNATDLSKHCKMSNIPGVQDAYIKALVGEMKAWVNNTSDVMILSDVDEEATKELIKKVKFLSQGTACVVVMRPSVECKRFASM